MEKPMCRCCKIHITGYHTPWHTSLNLASYNSLSNYMNQMCDSVITAMKTIILRILELSIQNNPWGRNFTWSCLGQGSVSAGNSGGILSAGLEKWEQENEMMHWFVDCLGYFLFSTFLKFANIYANLQEFSLCTHTTPNDILGNLKEKPQIHHRP